MADKTKLDRDIAWDNETIGQFNEAVSGILKNAKDISEILNQVTIKSETAYNGIQSGYQSTSMGTAVLDMKSITVADDFGNYITDIENYIESIKTDGATADKTGAEALLTICQKMASLKMRATLLENELTKPDCAFNPDAVFNKIEKLKSSWKNVFDAAKTKIDDLLQQLEKLGVNEESTEYSADPVNLATGNFVYDHEDIKTGGDIPLTFHRYYNAMDETLKETTTVEMVYENDRWVFNQAFLLKQYE